MDKTLSKMYKIKQLLPNVYVINSFLVMSYVVVGEKAAMILDTGYGYGDISQVVKEITTLPLYVVDTHGHVDHSGGNFFFDGPTYIHEKDVELYKQHHQPSLHRKVEESIKIFKRILFWRDFTSKTPAKFDEQRSQFNNFKFIKEGDMFDLGGITGKVIEIPGHTAGSVALYFSELKLAIVSDGACDGPYLFLPESTNLTTYRSSLKKLEKLELDYLLTGHRKRLYTKEDLTKWIYVAENPDFSNVRNEKELFFAPGVVPMRVWGKGDSKRKGPSLVLDPSKVD
ncbi:MBL fold metallo-hydrolase [Streptococcus oriscaviae]|uniref:MBL fold metallo-hydrolase n=1 Tax=Streptococcus oriscaviae TaxID=2781599 RepID=A0ABX7YKZ6_9STRE|nr:MBL fold metallo-hydrolase [Streptococcus oriscaviae]QUE54029.1 MBL fold metallo-hydrolase [Streptococcus oriscaviae]